jgi:uncharacterized protein with HEPN domain
MPRRSPVPSLTDIVEAIEHLRREVVRSLSLTDFEGNWQTRWIVEGGVEIISEASRRLPEELKTRHQGIPWRRVAGIGNVLRHDYQAISGPIMWSLVHDDLPALDTVCRASF